MSSQEELSQSTDKSYSQQSQFDSPVTIDKPLHQKYDVPDKAVWNYGQPVSVTEVNIQPGEEQQGYAGTIQNVLEKMTKHQVQQHPNNGNNRCNGNTQNIPPGQNIPSGHTILGHKPDHLNRHQVPVNADGGKHYEENFQGRKF